MSIVTEKKFLTTEELQTLKTIQNGTQSVILELGEIELLKIQLENRHQDAKTYLSNLANQEREFNKSLSETYGKVNINPETGEITKLD
jgi:hypothetical protein